MRVGLVYPEVYDVARFKQRRKEFPPFGVLYLAAILEENGFDVELLAATTDSPPADLERFEAIGISVASSATVNLLADYIKRAQITAGTPIAAGGVHATFFPEETLSDLSVDVVCYEEADLTISDLFRTMIRRGDLAAVPGVIFRANDGSVKRTMSSHSVASLNELPLPARHLLPKSDLIMNDRLAGYSLPIAHVMFSRGCPFPCAYCAAGNSEIRYRSGESARKELGSLVEDFAIEGFAIVDDNFIVRKSAVKDIATHISDLDLKWSALSRVDTVNEPLLETLANAGCVELKYGIESGSESLLKKMKKNTPLSRIRRTVDMTVDAGIRVKAFVIHGFPGENRETTRDTIELLDELSGKIDRVSVFRFVPLPGTSAYSGFLELGIKGTHLDRRNWDGDWSKFHIHHNDRHWWGSVDDFRELNESYDLLSDFVTTTFGDQ